MILTIDIGNSNIVATLFNDDGIIVNKDRQTTIKKNGTVLYQKWAEELKHKFSIEHINYVVSCVVPSIISDVQQIFKDAFGHDGYWIDFKSYQGISSLLNPPEEIGADLIASSVEVIKHYPQPAIIIDMGTATKVIVVDDNTIQGVIIAPGVGVLRDSITKSIPHLPSVALEFPDKIIGRTTMDSIQSGVMNFTKNAIEGVVNDISVELDKMVTPILTGGYARFFKDTFNDYHYDEDILSKGLFTIFQRESDMKC